ncbi:MAG: DUF4383 domain-containing protein [Waddliaceae bacterium]
MLRTLAILFGIVFIIVGVLGFLPTFVINGKLFDLFQINFEHNILHLVSGVLALLCGLSSGFASKMFFIIFGVVYAFLAFLGFIQGEGMLFEMIAINPADNWFNAGVAALSLLIGFGLKY